MNSKDKTIEFCSSNCCPTVTFQRADENVRIGGEEEGYTLFSQEQFTDFIAAAKRGDFDADI